MAETIHYISRISVKDLILAFESKSETCTVELSGPRAKSFGNVLNRHVIVRLDEFAGLRNIEKCLTKLETELNFYQVYNKVKHVAFQEQFFNILISIADIDDDLPTKKKTLILKTQRLVSVLNQKLPPNINHVIETQSTNQYKYSPYSIKTNLNTELIVDRSKINNGIYQQSTFECGNYVDIVNSDKEYLVSVKKLKKHFLPKAGQGFHSLRNEEKNIVTNKKFSVISNFNYVKQNEADIQQVDTVEEQKATKNVGKIEVISVTKLRTLFEKKAEENSKGLQIITDDKLELSENILAKSDQNENIPYIDRHLGQIRLQRSVSENNMNYRRLLKRVDIIRSNSALELNITDNKYKNVNISNEDSTNDSDDTLRLSIKPIKTRDVNYFAAKMDLDDTRGISIIEEVINQIDVDQTLANANLVVNPEDIKNADDEFEKLMSSATTK